MGESEERKKRKRRGVKGKGYGWRGEERKAKRQMNGREGNKK